MRVKPRHLATVQLVYATVATLVVQMCVDVMETVITFTILCIMKNMKKISRNGKNSK